jgi:hypothetical protein
MRGALVKTKNFQKSEDHHFDFGSFFAGKSRTSAFASLITVNHRGRGSGAQLWRGRTVWIRKRPRQNVRR